MEHLFITYFENQIKKYNEQNKSDKDKIIKQGIRVYHIGIQVALWVLFGLSVIAAVGSYGLSLYYGRSKQSWVAIADISCILAFVIFTLAIGIIIYICSRRYSSKNVEKYNKMLDLLLECVIDAYGNEASSKKVDELVKRYEAEISEIKENNSYKMKVIAAIVTTAIAAITTLFTNGKDWNMDISIWAVLVVLICFFTAIAILVIYLPIIISPTLNQYKIMLKHLKHLQIRLIKRK